MQSLTERIDELFAQNRGKEAETLMEESLKEALEEGRVADAIPIINELIGYCRETSQKEKSYQYAELVLKLLNRMNLQGTIPYATTLLNIANAYRAGGRLEDSLNVYGQVGNIYEKNLPKDHMLFANLHNNISLLYQELGCFEQAKESLLKALAIVEKREDTVFEVAVTYANLAATRLQLGQDNEARECFEKAIGLFEENGIQDTHYCAAVSSLATFYYKKGEYPKAEQYFLKAMEGIETHLGKNEYYYRMKENAMVCRKAYEKESSSSESIKGLDLCRAFYEQCGKPMLEERFPEYLDKIAVGLVGEGSDCFGYDDEISRDHDWGPGFCLWVTDETYDRIGKELEEVYQELPKEFKGFSFSESLQGKGRRGVHRIGTFYENILGCKLQKSTSTECKGKEIFSGTEIPWETVSDASLASAINGEVFTDPEGIFTEIRNRLRKEYPQRLRYIKIAESMARFCQSGQYNEARVLKRGDKVTAGILLHEAVKEALKLLYYIEGDFPPHDKWLLKGLLEKGAYGEILDCLERAAFERFDGETSVQGCSPLTQAAEHIALLLYQTGFISDTDPYLDVHVGELLFKAGMVDREVEDLAEYIAKREFEAFDKVKNLGGRADCQDDWFTFSIMRISQYLTWNKTMLLQYSYDFAREMERGHNLIEEKYGRMMESTAPAEYERIKGHFPELSSQKKEIIESVVVFQVKWMEEFALEYPCLAGNARSIHAYEDTPWNTSYETYLRGEISTYSDRMLELYGRYIVELSKKGENPAKKIMEHSVRMYGYESLEEAEADLRGDPR